MLVWVQVCRELQAETLRLQREEETVPVRTVSRCGSLGSIHGWANRLGNGLGNWHVGGSEHLQVSRW